MTRTLLARTVVPSAMVAALAGAGCGVEKSESPLSPSVAGPIAGVEISAPRVVEPAQGAKFKQAQQPIRLTVENASTNGVRPLWYSFEVATDNGFQTKVFAVSSVAPGSGGRTSVQIEKLDLGRTYYWRAWAGDGANTGPPLVAQFDILPSPFVGAPTPLSPINSETIASRRPTLRTRNAEKNAAVGGLVYEFQVSSNSAFTQITGAAQANEAAGETAVTVDTDLPNNAIQYWRVRAFDAETMGPWSIIQGFYTPNTTPAPGPGPSPNPGNGNCDSLVNNKPALVECIHSSLGYKPTNEVQAFEVTKRVAWALRGEGAGLLIKNGGENIVSWQGYSFSASRICYPDGHIFKVISDAGPGGANSPSWQDNDFVDRNLYVPAIDPSKK
jgi:hypothetical protein